MMNHDERRHWPVRALLALVLALCAIGPTAARADDDSGDDDSDQGNWPMFNHDRAGTRTNPSETALSKSSVPGLKVKWTFGTPLPVSGTPVVQDDMVYAGDMSGMFYALNSNGTKLWSTQLGGSITASALVKGNVVVIGDLSGNLYGLARNTGEIAWSFKPDSHPQAAIFGSATQVGKYVAIGVASNEEAAAANPSYPCCSSRGSLVLLDPSDGTVEWQTYMITDAQKAAGSSGSGIWSTPTYDPSSKLIYVTTGNNYSQPTTLSSDAIIALDSRNGTVVWSNQRFPNDEWNYRFLPATPDHPDADFGDSPQIYTLANGTKVVGAGQKSGFYHVLNAQTGALINQIQPEVGGTLGGLFADSAVANGIVFANGENWPAPGASPPKAGDVFALAGDGSAILWTVDLPFSPILGGVATANSVVYFTSTYGPYGSKLYAVDASTGSVLTTVNIGNSDSGPAVSHGQIYVGTGDALQVGFGLGPAPGTITALGL